jgi:hypothetical protein
MTTISPPPPVTAPQRPSAPPLSPSSAGQGDAESAKGLGGAGVYRWWAGRERSASLTTPPRGRRDRRAVDVVEQERIADTFHTALVLHVVR